MSLRRLVTLPFKKWHNEVWLNVWSKILKFIKVKIKPQQKKWISACTCKWTFHYEDNLIKFKFLIGCDFGHELYFKAKHYYRNIMQSLQNDTNPKILFTLCVTATFDNKCIFYVADKHYKKQDCSSRQNIKKQKRQEVH